MPIKRLDWLLQISVFLCAFSLPVSLTLSWIFLSFGIAILVLYLVSERTTMQTSWTEVCLATPLTLPLGAFAVSVAVSGFMNGGVLEGLRSLVTLRTFLVYFFAHAVFRIKPWLISPTLSILLVVSAVAGIWGTVQQLTGFHPFNYHYLQGTGFLGGPMSFAGQMQITSLLALGGYLSSGYKKLVAPLSHKIIFGLVTVANCLGLVFAGERSAWLGFAAGVLVMALVVSRGIFWRCLVFIFVGAASGLLMVPVFRQRLMPLLQWHKDTSTQVRLFLWEQALNLWHSSPLFGIGIRRFPHFKIPEAIVPGRSTVLEHAHSNYLHLLATTGIVGLVSYLWLMFVVIKSCVMSWKQNTDKETLECSVALGILGGNISLLIAGLFEYNFGASSVRLMQWFVLAMLSQNLTSSHRSSDAAPGRG